MAATTERIQGAIDNLRASGEKLVIHRCTLCGYPCGYLFRQDELFYDSGCACVWEGPRPFPKSDLVDCLTRNPHLIPPTPEEQSR
jgi:hypothetical protein